MSSVCVACGLDVDVDGKLFVQIAEGSVCQPNSLICTEAGLRVHRERRYLRRSFSNQAGVSTVHDTGFSVERQMTQYTTLEDNGSVVGLWTIQGDGSVLINCGGVYSFSQQTIVNGATGHVVGGRARVIDGPTTPDIICTSEFHDYSNTVDLAVAMDGPEWSATNVRHKGVGSTISYISNVYTELLGEDITWAGEFTMTYLGEWME